MALRNCLKACKLHSRRFSINTGLCERTKLKRNQGLCFISCSRLLTFVSRTLPRNSIRDFSDNSGVPRDIFSYSNIDYIVHVKTGDQLSAGTDANVKIILHSETGEKTEGIKLDYFFRDDFERGQLDSFQMKNIPTLKDINKIEFWRDDAGFGSNWFVDYIEVESIISRKRFMFPVFRWIRADRHYVIHHMDNCLPQFDPDPDTRAEELEYKLSVYECSQKAPGMPSQVSY